MKESTKQEIDRIINNVVGVRKDNSPTYWMMMVALGMFFTTLLIWILKTGGIYLLVTACFVYIMNNLVSSWQEIRAAEQTEIKKAERKSKKNEKVNQVIPSSSN